MKMDPAIKITNEERYTLEFGGKKHTGFIKESEWHGFARFVDEHGASIIVLLESTALSLIRKVTEGVEEMKGNIAALSPSLYPLPEKEEENNDV